MTNTTINKAALFTVFIASLSTMNSAQGATTISLHNQIGQNSLNEKIAHQSDKKLAQLVSSFSTKMDTHLSSKLLKKFDL